MSRKSKKFIYIRPRNALIFYLIYIIVSQLLFLITTGGWAGVFELVYYIWVLPIFWVILALGFLSFDSGGFIRRRFFLRILVAIAIVQAIALLFNYSTCGGSWGQEGYNFVQRIGFKITNFNSSVFEPCNLNPPIKPFIPYEIVLIIRCIYYLLNLILICSFLNAKKSRKKSW